MKLTKLEKGKENWFQITQVMIDTEKGNYAVKTIRLQRDELAILGQEISAMLGDRLEA